MHESAPQSCVATDTLWLPGGVHAKLHQPVEMSLFWSGRYLAAKAELAGLESEILALARAQEQEVAMSEVSCSHASNQAHKGPEA